MSGPGTGAAPAARNVAKRTLGLREKRLSPLLPGWRIISSPEARRPGLQGPPSPGCESCGAPPLAICSAATAAEASCLRQVPGPLDTQAFSCVYFPAAAVPPDPLRPTCCRRRRCHRAHCACPARLQRLRAGPAPCCQAPDKPEPHNSDEMIPCRVLYRVPAPRHRSE